MTDFRLFLQAAAAGGIFLSAQTAGGHESCEPGEAPEGTVYICDPLRGSTVATERNGGDLTQDGFVVHGNNDSLVYVWGQQITEFCLEFDVIGIDGDWSVLDQDNYHIFEMLEVERLDFDHCGLALRIYGCDPAYPEGCNPPDPDPSGSVKLKTWCPEGNDEPFMRQDVGWQPDHLYHMKVVSRDGTITWTRDGGEVTRPANVSAFSPRFGRALLPNDGWPAYFTIRGSKYSNFMITSDPSCVPPNPPQCGAACDDGDPCTGNDTVVCPGRSCAGTPLPEGAACDDGDPQTVNTTCRGGFCSIECSLPHPDGIVVAEDVTASILYPDSNFPDKTALDVEEDANGGLEAVFYIKFQVEPPPGKRVASANINLFCDSILHPNGAEGNGGALHVVEDNGWSEDTLTWNGKPAWSDGAVASVEQIDRGNWYGFDVSAAVASGGTFSFASVPIGNNGGHYLSKEGGAANCRQPHMSVTYEACEAAPCDDGNRCTGGDAIECGGTECKGAPLPDGTACDDGDPATTDDRCTGGTCKGSGSGNPDAGGNPDAVVPDGGGKADASSRTGDANSAANSTGSGGCGCASSAVNFPGWPLLIAGLFVMRRQTKRSFFAANPLP